MGYGCRLCQATAFRRVPDAPSLYACTGCGAVFASPERWRRMVTHQAPVGSPPALVDDTRQAVAMRAIGNGGGWTSTPLEPGAFGCSPEEVAAIKAAAARANRSKKRR